MFDEAIRRVYDENTETWYFLVAEAPPVLVSGREWSAPAYRCREKKEATLGSGSVILFSACCCPPHGCGSWALSSFRKKKEQYPIPARSA
jgi:hypothetical protein